jgi:hypothetical protein
MIALEMFEQLVILPLTGALNHSAVCRISSHRGLLDLAGLYRKGGSWVELAVWPPSKSDGHLMVAHVGSLKMASQSEDEESGECIIVQLIPVANNPSATGDRGHVRKPHGFLS